MAHPYSQHREVHAGRSRAHHVLKHGHFKRGGEVHKDEAADRKLFGKLIKEHDAKVPGRASGGRLDKYARGGKTKHGTQVNIAIVSPHGKDKDHEGNTPTGIPPMGMPPPAPMPPRPPMAGPPPGGPPGGPMGGPPMPPRPPGVMKRGGKVFARGGKVHMTAGSFSGEGRLEKKKAYGLKPHKKG